MASIVSLVNVEIWSDVVCPWCFIGKRRFEAAVARLREKGVTEPINVVFRAYQLDPTAPMGAPTPVVDAYAKKFGGAERAIQILDHVTKVAAADNIDFNMDIALRANTILCHRALHWVLLHHGPEKQNELKEALLSAYFTNGQDVGDLHTVLACAENIGLDRSQLQQSLESGEGIDEVRQDFQAAIDMEISGVPCFVIDGRYMIPGAQDVDVFEQVLERVLSK
ncbi:MAG: DsbA family oxidoreductase [Ilumatobacteraceae bacterium]